jgi:hypothetical protein
MPELARRIRLSNCERSPDGLVLALPVEPSGIDLERDRRILVAEHGGDCDGIETCVDQP